MNFSNVKDDGSAIGIAVGLLPKIEYRGIEYCVLFPSPPPVRGNPYTLSQSANNIRISGQEVLILFVSSIQVNRCSIRGRSLAAALIKDIAKRRAKCE